ncbi:hypothetical protein NQ314_011978 [Rhamnusium bicolor]|uniref:MADF domain-containing protein n=1 Tax=Rhamnusium bicolor TaxID=1586634 RepID=A0AAV8XFC4_9CUCU|nr:hypothetical protein NQ314_011978 [Rhamnusium bicolor]
MNIDLELFISEVEKRPALYNVKLKEYSDRNLKRNLWNELCDQFVENWHNLSVSERVVKGDKFLLGYGRKRCSELPNASSPAKICNPSGKTSEHALEESMMLRKRHHQDLKRKRRKYMYFDQLLFLCNHMESRETTSNLQSPSSSHPNSDTENEEPNIVLPERPTLSNTRKKQTTKSYEESLLKILQEKKAEENEIEEDKYFLLSLLPHFGNLMKIRNLSHERKL